MSSAKTRAARYETDGRYFTPIEGQNQLPLTTSEAWTAEVPPPAEEQAPEPLPPIADLDADIEALVAQWSEPKR